MMWRLLIADVSQEIANFAHCNKSVFMKIKKRPNPNEAFPSPEIGGI